MARESKYKRDFTQQYFWPLKSFHYNPALHWSTANRMQDELADKLSKDYQIHEGNIFRLIIYTDRAWSYATESEIEFYYSDMTEIADFEKEPFSIDKIVIRGSDKPLGYPRSFEINNPYLIDELYRSMLDFMDFKKVLKKRRDNTKKKRPSAKIIKLIATEIYNELTQVEKISEWKSYCIVGFIFAFYQIGIKTEDPIKSEEQYNQWMKEERSASAETYLQYLAHRIEKYIIN